MKYGESAFDVLYLLFAVIGGCLLLRGAKDRTVRMMGIATLVLGIGDAFHLVPRVLNYFVEGDWNAALGIGKFVTSVTMTVFYLLLYDIRQGVYGERKERGMTIALWALTLARIVCCLFPQNGWRDTVMEGRWQGATEPRGRFFWHAGAAEPLRAKRTVPVAPRGPVAPAARRAKRTVPVAPCPP